jgi:hypothetical protein
MNLNSLESKERDISPEAEPVKRATDIMCWHAGMWQGIKEIFLDKEAQ